MAERVVIVGSGPAGLTAGLYAARADLSPLCLEGPEAGGQLATTTDVENYPGFSASIMGPQLIEEMHRQAERFGVRFAPETAESVDLSRRPFRIRAGERTIETEALIVASGASARWLGLESEQKLRGHGVSACATCDGFFFKGKDVVVVGGGDTAIEEALFLTKFCNKVIVVHRRDQLRASRVMADRAARSATISFIWNAVVEEIRDPAEMRVSAVRLRDVKENKTFDVECQGAFVAIGHNPNTGFLGGQLETRNGFVVCRDGTTATSAPGVFAAGDVMDPRYRQAVTAAGTGCMAAIDAEKFLGSLE
jgi:thioredoxin reductase (NADPH)